MADKRKITGSWRGAALTQIAALHDLERGGAQEGRDAAAAYVERFIEEMKASGFVAEALKRHGIEGAAVAPPAR